MWMVNARRCSKCIWNDSMHITEDDIKKCTLNERTHSKISSMLLKQKIFCVKKKERQGEMDNFFQALI